MYGQIDDMKAFIADKIKRLQKAYTEGKEVSARLRCHAIDHRHEVSYLTEQLEDTDVDHGE